MDLNQSDPTLDGPGLPLLLTLYQLIRSHPTHRGVLQTICLGPTLGLKHAMLSLWNVLFPLLCTAHPAHSDSILFCFLEVSFHLPYLHSQASPTPHPFWYLYCSVHHSQMFSCFLSCISTLLAWKVLGSRSIICTVWVTQHWDRAGNEQSANKQRQSIHVE